MLAMASPLFSAQPSHPGVEKLQKAYCAQRAHFQGIYPKEEQCSAQHQTQDSTRKSFGSPLSPSLSSQQCSPRSQGARSAATSAEWGRTAVCGFTDSYTKTNRSKPRLLDLFCGAGGAATGYARSGFEVVGVDHVAQPNYPFEFVQMDALVFMRDECYRWHEFFGPYDAIHASPPCQGYTTMANRFPEKRDSYPMLIEPIRELLGATGLPYVIENVMGARAHLESPHKICGSALGLGVARHRLFETNFPMLTQSCACGHPIVGVYGERPDGRRLNSKAVKRIQYAASSLEEGSEAMGIDWMTWDELREAIPPAYTELIGHQLMQHVRSLESV